MNTSNFTKPFLHKDYYFFIAEKRNVAEIPTELFSVSESLNKKKSPKTTTPSKMYACVHECKAKEN